MEYTPDSSDIPGPRAPRLLDMVRRQIRVRHYSIRTEQAYLGWIRRFILANGKRHPRTMGEAEVSAFLSSLATDGNVAASTQNQALSALLFLYRQVLGIELPWMEQVVRAKRPRRLPVVLSPDEVSRLFAAMPHGVTVVMAQLLYGAGMRLMECLRLRIKDVDFSRSEICVRCGKGNKDRRVPLPVSLRAQLLAQREWALLQHRADLGEGMGQVHLPHALARKYPNAATESGWQYPFPSARVSTRSAYTAHRPSSRQRGSVAAYGQSRTGQGGHHQAGDMPFASPQLCNASTGSRARHSHRTGAAGAQGPGYHPDLHACVGARRRCAAEPVGSTAGEPAVPGLMRTQPSSSALSRTAPLSALVASNA